MIRTIGLVCFVLFEFVFHYQTYAQARSSKDEKHVVSFVYHRFGDSRFPSTNVSNEDFEAHLKHLKENGFEVMNFSESVEYLQSNKPAQKVACITVDDGYRSFFQNGWPLLKKYGFSATVFVNTETVGASDYMDWESLKQLQESGIEIGNHSHAHPYFLNLSDRVRVDSFRTDLRQSQELFEKQLGKKPSAYAYPYGEFDTSMKKVLAEEGLLAGAAQNSGLMHSGSDFFQLPRFPMAEKYAALEDFSQKANVLPLRVEQLDTLKLGFTKEQPRFQIEFDKSNLSLTQIQCFVQGSACSKSVQVMGNGKVKMIIKPPNPVQERRTLFTITCPDRNGKWHWFSFTWIRPDLK